MSLVINFLTGAPRTPAPVSPAPPASGDGHFGNLLNDLWESEAAGDDSLGGGAPATDDDREHAGKSVADVFNQHGLFARDEAAAEAMAAPAPEVAVVAADAPPQDSVSNIAAGGAIDTDTIAPGSGSRFPAPHADIKINPRALALPAQAARFDGVGEGNVGSVQRALLMAGSTAEDVIPHLPTFPVTVPARTARPTTSPISRPNTLVQAAVDTAEDGQPGDARPARHDPAESGAASDAQVTLGMNEGNATVVARAVDGGPVERIRLRERMAALLARYGLRTGDVRLNGTVLSGADDPKGQER